MCLDIKGFAKGRSTRKQEKVTGFRGESVERLALRRHPEELPHECDPCRDPAPLLRHASQKEAAPERPCEAPSRVRASFDAFRCRAQKMARPGGGPSAARSRHEPTRVAAVRLPKAGQSAFARATPILLSPTKCAPQAHARCATRRASPIRMPRSRERSA